MVIVTRLQTLRSRSHCLDTTLDPFKSVKLGFHMIAGIAGDVRIAQICDQRSLRRNGNFCVKFANDRCVVSDPCV